VYEIPPISNAKSNGQKGTLIHRKLRFCFEFHFFNWELSDHISTEKNRGKWWKSNVHWW